MPLFGLGKNPVDRALADLDRGRHQQAAKALEKAWPRLADERRQDALAAWGRALAAGAPAAAWEEAVAAFLAAAGDPEIVRPGLVAAMEGDQGAPQGPWLEQARQEGADLAWREAAAGDPEATTAELAAWYLEAPGSAPLEAAFGARVEGGEAPAGQVLEALGRLVGKFSSDPLRQAFVRGLAAQGQWTPQAAAAAQWHLGLLPGDGLVAAWAVGNLSPPLEGGWAESLAAVAAAGGEAAPSARRLLALDLALRGEAPGPFAEDLAAAALADSAWLAQAGPLLVRTEGPGPQAVAAVAAAVAAGVEVAGGMAFLLSHAADPATLAGLPPPPWPAAAVDALAARWQSPPPGDHRLLAPFLASLLHQERGEEALALLARVEGGLGEEARLWAGWAALAGEQPALARRWLDGLETPGAAHARSRLLEEEGDSAGALGGYQGEGDGWGGVRAGLMLEAGDREEEALQAWQGVGEGSPWAARLARLCRSRLGDPALTAADLALAGPAATELGVEAEVAAGQALAAAGRWEAAGKAFQAGWDRGKDPRCLQGVLEASHRWAGECLEAGRPAEARQAVERAMMVSDEPRLRRQWAACDPPPAAWPRLRDLASEPLPAALLGDLGWLAWRAGERASAAEHSLRAVRQGASSALDLARLARILLEVKATLDEAGLERLTAAIAGELGEPLAAAVRAAQGQAGRPPRKIGEGQAGMLAAWTLLAMGRQEEAAAALRQVLGGPGRALGDGPARGKGLAALGYWLVEAGDLEGAGEAWERAGHLGLGAAAAATLGAVLALERGVAEHEAGRRRRAERLLGAALSDPLTKEHAHRSLAALHTLGGDLSAAMPHWQALLDAWGPRDSGHWPGWRRLATEMASLCAKGAEAQGIERAAWEDTLESLREGARSYRDLGVAPGASPEAVEAAYFRRLREFGPERQVAAFKRVEEARARLKDPEMRARIELFRPTPAPSHLVREQMAAWGAQPLDYLVPGLGAGPSWRPDPGEGAPDARPFPTASRGPFSRAARRWLAWEPIETAFV